MIKKEDDNIGIKNENIESQKKDKIQNNNLNEQNKYNSLKFSNTNDNNDINVLHTKIENNKRKNSNNIYESNSKIIESKSRINNKKENNDLDITQIKKFLNFQNKYMKNENDIVEINKCLHAYIKMNPGYKINPTFFYILKNYHKDIKLNQILNENNHEEKYTPKKNKNDNELENSKLNAVEAIKHQSNKKANEIIQLRSKIIKLENNYSIKENEINNQKVNIKNKKRQKENLNFKSDEELINFVKNKFKEKNSLYLIELKNKSFISNIDDNNEIKSKENNNPELNILKEENKNIKNRNIKLKKDLEKIGKEMKLIEEKNKELIDEINKKETLIKKYEKIIEDNKNQKQKNLSNNNKKINENKNILINGFDYNQIKIEKLSSFNYEKRLFKKPFNDELSIINIQKLEIISDINTKDMDVKHDFNLDKKEPKFKENNNFEKIFIQSINYSSAEKKYNINFTRENIINLSINNSKIKNDIPKKFDNIEISNNLEIFLKSFKNENIFLNQGLSIEKNYNFYYDKINKKDLKGILSIEKTNIIFFNELKKEYNLEITKCEIMYLNETKYLLKDILKIIKLENIYYKSSFNIINKFKNIKISKIISFTNKIIPSAIQNYKDNNINSKNENQIKNEEITNNLDLNNSKIIDKNINNNEKLDIQKKEKSERLNRAMNRIKKKNQIKNQSEKINSESFKEGELILNKARTETTKYEKSGKIFDIAKKLEIQMTKEENIIDEKVDENKNSNVLGIISMQPIIKKKKKNKINFNFDD